MRFAFFKGVDDHNALSSQQQPISNVYALPTVTYSLYILLSETWHVICGGIHMDCGVLAVNRILLKRVARKWRKGAMPVAVDVPYQQLSALRLQEDNDDAEACVTVVVGKEGRIFKVDPQILAEDLFRSLLGKATKNKAGDSFVILLEQCDSILFEHILWLVYNDDPTLLTVNLEELVEFYAQDSA